MESCHLAAATTDLRAVLKGVLGDHLGLRGGMLDTGAFPGSAGLSPMAGLIPRT